MQGAWKSIATRPAPAEFFGCNAITPGGCRKRPQGCPKIVVRSITKLNLANDYPTYIGRKYANKLLVRPKPHENAEIASVSLHRIASPCIIPLASMDRAKQLRSRGFRKSGARFLGRFPIRKRPKGLHRATEMQRLEASRVARLRTCSGRTSSH